MGGISGPTYPPNPYPALVIDGLQGLTAALKLEGKEDTTAPRNVWIVWAAFLFDGVMGIWRQLNQSFVRMLVNTGHPIYVLRIPGQTGLRIPSIPLEMPVVSLASGGGVGAHMGLINILGLIKRNSRR